MVPLGFGGRGIDPNSLWILVTHVTPVKMGSTYVLLDLIKLHLKLFVCDLFEQIKLV